MYINKIKQEKLYHTLQVDAFDSFSICYIPNEIFDDFISSNEFTFNDKAHAYSFYFIFEFVYKNRIFGISKNISDLSLVNLVSLITGNYRKYTKLFSKGGLLDCLGYTTNSTNYPVGIKTICDNAHNKRVDDIEFIKIKDIYNDLPENEERNKYQNKLGHSPNLTCKVPLKLFKRTVNSKTLNGTMYDNSNTHPVTPMNFIEMICNPSIGVKGFYVYNYLKSKCLASNTKMIQTKITSLSKSFGVTDITMTKVLKSLEQFDYITIENRMSNTSNQILGKNIQVNNLIESHNSWN